MLADLALIDQSARIALMAILHRSFTVGGYGEDVGIILPSGHPL